MRAIPQLPRRGEDIELLNDADACFIVACAPVAAAGRDEEIALHYAHVYSRSISFLPLLPESPLRFFTHMPRYMPFSPSTGMRRCCVFRALVRTAFSGGLEVLKRAKTRLCSISVRIASRKRRRRQRAELSRVRM